MLTSPLATLEPGKAADRPDDLNPISLLTVGDIVIADPPTPDAPDRRPGRPRPTLVVDIAPPEAGGAVVVADTVRVPGHASLRPSQVQIEGEGMNRAGLIRPTVFDFARLQRIAPEANAIARAHGGPRVIGHLTRIDMIRAKRAHCRAAQRLADLIEIPGFGASTPQVGDVAFLYAPYEDAPNIPGRDPHPALITRRRTLRIDGVAHMMVSFAPGTSQKLYAGNPETNVVLEDDTAHLAAGLNKPTRFKMDQQVEIPWRPEWIYHLSPEGPFCGRLRQSDLIRAGKAYKAAGIEPRAIDTKAGERERQARRDSRRRAEALTE